MTLASPPIKSWSKRHKALWIAVFAAAFLLVWFLMGAVVQKQDSASLWTLLVAFVFSTVVLAVVLWLMMREIQRRKAAEQALRATNDGLEQSVRQRTQEIERQKRMLSAVLESMSDSFFVNKGGKIVFANSSFLKLLGAKDASEVIGRSPLEFSHPNDHAAIKERMQLLQKPGVRLPPNQQKALCIDGQTVDVEVSSVSFMDGDELAILVIIRDLTQSKMIERQLWHAQRMEAVGQLTGGMAHDFNNLLAVIIGNLDLLEEKLDPNGPVHELAGQALTAAIRGAELTRKLLAFSRQQALETKVFDLNELVASTAQLLRRTLGEAISVRLSLADNLWLTKADPVQVESALTNLAINARDAMPEGGLLTIETGNKRLDELYAATNHEVQPGDYVMLAVSDTGVGIPPDVLPKVFEPFFTTKTDGKGSGLGLAMIHGFAKQSRGHVKIYSEPGHGTTVRLYLPSADRAADYASYFSPCQEIVPPASAVILIVDDNPDVRRVAVQHITELGYQVVEAGDAQQALEILSGDQHVDLLFTDVVMPGGLMGDELARRAQELRPNLKVLFTSGFAEASIEGGHGAASVKRRNLLSKPYRKADLARRLEEVLCNSDANA